MSLYTDGTQITLPVGTVWPGVVDPTLVKLMDIAYPGGPAINMQDYSDEGIPHIEIGGEARDARKITKLGDEHHFDNNETLVKYMHKPEDYISNRKVLSTRDWR